jgi:hypothetical protein
MNFGEDLIKDGISRVVNGLKNQLTQSRQAAKEIVPSELCQLSRSCRSAGPKHEYSALAIPL